MLRVRLASVALVTLVLAAAPGPVLGGGKGAVRAPVQKKARAKAPVSKAGRARNHAAKRSRAAHLRRKGEHRGYLLEKPGDAAGARLDLIAGAKREILLSAYILTNDRVGRVAMAQLRAAARAGKKVKLLVDGAGSYKLPKAALAHLAQEGVEVAVYNPLKGKRLLRPGRLSYRMHDKLLVVDGEAMILGGRNLEEGYFGLNEPGYSKFTDIDVQMSGPAAQRAQKYFHELWRSRHVERVTPGSSRSSAKRIARYGRKLDRSDRLSSRRGLKSLRENWRRGEPIRLDHVRFLHEDPRTLENKDQRLHRQILGFIDSARTEVEIQTPYLVPTPELLEAIARARERGTTVRFLTNSLKVTHGHDKLPQWAYESKLAALARAGAEVWEHRGERILHAKTAVIDGRKVFVGSYNQDPRSRSLNKEIGLLADAPELARGLLARGERLRKTALLAAGDGKVTKEKKRTCRWFCRSFARYLFAPLARLSGLYGQL